MTSVIPKSLVDEITPDDREKIQRYLKEISTSLIGTENTDSVEIMEMIPGTYNLNFHVRVSNRHFIFRINIEQQSGLSNQIEYEFKALKFLEGHCIAPKPYYFDESKTYFDCSILIEEHFKGPHLSFDGGDIREAAKLLGRVHSLNPGGLSFMVWRDPLAETYKLAQADLWAYEAKRTVEKKTISLASKLLARSEICIEDHREKFRANTLNHTDPVRDNFIKSPQGLRLIDWEKPRLDDYTYDICVFLSEPAQLWCSENILNQEDRLNFLEMYARFAKKDLDHLANAVQIREPLVSLHWVLWGANRLCDFQEGRTSPDLLRAHEQKVPRFERLANPENIEKLLDS